MNTTSIRRAVASLGLAGLLAGSLLLTAVAPASARPDPGQPVSDASIAQARTVVREVEVPVPVDSNAMEPVQIALGALGGAALAGGAILVAGNARRTRPATA